MPNLSHHNITRASQVLQGSAQLGGYNGGKNGVEWTPQFVYRPTSQQPLTFTGALVAGATTATLTGNWTPPSGFYNVILSNGQQVIAYLTTGSTAVTFYPGSIPNTGGSFATQGIQSAATANAFVQGVPPLLGVANGYAASQAIGAGGSALLNGANTGSITVNGTTYSPAGIADVPRNVVAAWTTASNITVSGFDAYGNAQTELLTTPAGSTGKKAFAVITGITSSASITAFTAGFGAVLGLPFHIKSGGFMGALLADAVDAGTFVQADDTNPPTNATGDTRGTYTCTGALNGAKNVCIELKVQDSATQIGAFGLTPA